MIYVTLFIVPATGLAKSDVGRGQRLITSTTEMTWCTRIQLAYKRPSLLHYIKAPRAQFKHNNGKNYIVPNIYIFICVNTIINLRYHLLVLKRNCAPTKTFSKTPFNEKGNHFLVHGKRKRVYLTFYAFYICLSMLS